ncbi:Elongation of very long chain fatty acids protein 7 [Dermatophagoides farinae]|uniref:Elongation of very long chain fatty acids protein n=1 Tax=Dermatophagoides farinae TaxID=6954 RepID=A0A922HSS7_DERFA|nr:Elongation of very long chain fatty acids protein 7 [Dermatophagoides farinae]
MMISKQFFNAHYWNGHCDPRVVNQWLMHNGPYKLLVISIIYLLAIYFGVQWMQHRKPFAIRMPMFMFNVLLVVLNLYFFYESFWWTNYGRDLLNFHFPSPFDSSERAHSIISLYYYYQISKFIDYMDTVFLVLRKKNDHITVLHVYHHVSVPIVGWFANWMSPTMPVLGLFAMLNSFCHMLMYTYYSLAALGGHRVRPYLCWKRYITCLQLLQFLILGLYGLYLNFRHIDYPQSFRWLLISQAIIYLIMFGNFYKRSYYNKHNNNNNNECRRISHQINGKIY